ncbi:MAG: DUF255 domain-containing protein [Gammaproteobacteria bacterium]|nr:DUF255 domain-containing protein [Gammaproteobacteria bacterium]
MMKKILLLFILQFFIFHATAENIQHATVNDYLQEAAAKAKRQGIKANDLINESSPYLLQHAYNPVKWHAWGDAAFEKARKENKPIFLSIGYSTCHWCHVMAHESFENKEIAALLNKYFICIKVDREQRPDIDSVYMSATQLISGHGGWPMSVFLDHKLRPFHAATYYPPFSTQQRKGLKEIALKINELWKDDQALIDQVATSVTAQITVRADDVIEQGKLDDNTYQLALQQIISFYDEDFAGFSVAPKFPRPGIFAYLNALSVTDIKNKNVAQKMMKSTLDAMASGGIHDQIAGGFHRYSVDQRWQVPHFEKMLYNQALMVIAYSELYQNDPQEKYKQLVYQTLKFTTEEMRSLAGGFYSALDADSELADNSGRRAEGAYYLWHESELKNILSEAEFKFIKKYFHLQENGNIDSDPQDEFTDLNIFYVDEEFKNGALSKQQESLLESAAKKLNRIRRLRPGPHLDDKVITAWNGMMIAAFAKASVVFDDKGLLEEAVKTARFIMRHSFDEKSSKLYRQYRENKSSIDAALSDYVWLIYGVMEIYQASNDKQWLSLAIDLHADQNELFLDPVSGAYYESSANDKNLLFRSKSIFDGALPSANAIALSNLRELSALSSDVKQKKIYAAQADKLVASFATIINRNPAAASMLLSIEVQGVQ